MSYILAVPTMGILVYNFFSSIGWRVVDEKPGYFAMDLTKLWVSFGAAYIILTMVAHLK